MMTKSPPDVLMRRRVAVPKKAVDEKKREY